MDKYTIEKKFENEKSFLGVSSYGNYIITCIKKLKKTVRKIPNKLPIVKIENINSRFVCWC